MNHNERLLQNWFVASTSHELRTKPLARTILDTPLVLFRSQGKPVVLLDRCPHRNAPLAAGKVVGGTIQCPYHGWRFDVDGACVFRPGSPHASEDKYCDNKMFQSVERNGLVWVNLSESASEATLPKTSWSSDPLFASFIWTSRIQAEFVDAIENLLDATHTPFVHSGLVRTAEKSQKFRATVRVRDSFVEAEYHDEGKQSGWVSQLFERDRASSFGRFVPPCIAELEYTSRRGTEFVLNSHFTPETSEELQVYSVFFVRRTRIPTTIKRVLLGPFFRRILNQDRHILRLQQDNIRRFGRTDFRYWEGDLLRPLIETWMQEGEFPTDHSEQMVELEL